MEEFWNKRFEEEEFVYGIKPNVFFRSEIDKIKNKGKALFPLEGEGRNACYAAQLGWEVDAFDFSESGKQKALKLCDANDISICYEVTKVEDYKVKKDTYNLIVLIFSHLDPENRILFHKKVIDSLKSGGKLIVEAFHPKQLENNYPSGGPKNKDLLYTLTQLKDDFKALSKSDGSELKIDLAEGDYHYGKAYVTRFVGTK
jgi:hypothetical protein